jgi:two-component sensor histidine kinase
VSALPQQAPRGWLDSRQSILIVGASLIALSILLFVAMAEANRQATVRDAERAASTLVATLAEHAGRIVDVSNVIADQAMDLVDERPWDEIASSREIYLALRRMLRRHDFIGSIWLVDERGVPRVTTRSFPAPSQSVADRPHFRVQQDYDAGPYLSPLVQSRVADEINMVMSRRISAENGGFRGVVLVVLNPSEFERVYREVRAPYPVSIDLFRSDLTVLIRHPIEPAAGERKQIDAQLLRARPVEDLVWLAAASLGPSRLMAYHAVGGFPLYVSVEITHADIMASWLRSTNREAIFAVAALGFILLFVSIAAVRCGKENAMRGELARLNVTLEDRIRERTETIERLMAELNHRVKNSLQMISGLLHMHSRVARPEVRAELAEARNRVLTVARVHDRLYRTDKLATVKLDELLRDVGDDLSPTLLTIDGAPVTLIVEAEPVEITVDKAVPLVLAVNELVTNAVKYAFPRGRPGRIRVTLRDGGDVVSLVVEDDGVGLPPGFDMTKSTGLGFTLVTGLVSQVGGTLASDAAPTGGARFAIAFPRVAPKPAESSANGKQAAT